MFNWKISMKTTGEIDSNKFEHWTIIAFGLSFHEAKEKMKYYRAHGGTQYYYLKASQVN